MKTIVVGPDHVALVDDVDYVLVKDFKWRIYKHVRNRTLYARTDRKDAQGVRRCLLMHRLILEITEGDILVDHQDGNGLNNQRYNIRSCTKQQNQQHRTIIRAASGFMGVTSTRIEKRRKPWKAAIKSSRRTINLGRCDTPEEAALMYNRAAFRLCGDFATLNVVRISNDPIIEVS